VSGRTFGRRPNPLLQRPPIQASAAPEFQRKIAAFDEAVVEQAAPPVVLADAQAPSVDEELEAWKKSRKGFTIPWRQLSLMASLSFGIASFVLPASVNRNVDYLLYALAGISLYVGMSKRLKNLIA
jgi:hypothetical protein